MFPISTDETNLSKITVSRTARLKMHTTMPSTLAILLFSCLLCNMETITKTINSEIWRNCSEVKNTCCFSRKAVPGSSSQLSLPLVPGLPEPSSGLCEHPDYMPCIHADKTLINIVTVNSFLKIWGLNTKIWNYISLSLEIHKSFTPSRVLPPQVFQFLRV